MARLASRVRTSLITLALVPALVAPLVAQVTTGAEGRTVTTRDTSNAPRFKTLFTYRDAALAAAFVGLTVAMLPADRHIAQSLQDPDIRTNKFFDKSATGVEVITSPGAFIIGGGLYAAGKLTNHPDLADRATSETDRSLELRTRDRQRKLISKIDEALRRIADGSYGYCEDTGEPIGIARLDARPTATLSLEAQERHERRERVHRDD